MNRTPFVRRIRTAPALLLVAVLAGCGPTDDILAPEAGPTVLLGRVSAPASGTSGGDPDEAAATSLAGIEVRVDGDSASVFTNESGEFRLEVRSEDGRLRIRFRRGDMDVRIEVSGVPAGGVIQLDVALDHDRGTVLSSIDGREAEFEGVAGLVSVNGDTPARVARVELTDHHRTWSVDILEGSTAFDEDGDVRSFDDMLAALERSDLAVEIEGEGERQDDGSVVAAEVKVETDDRSDHDSDDDDDSDDDGSEDEGSAEFEGRAALVSLEGEAPTRTARVELSRTGGTVLVDILEGSTAFDEDGDVLTFEGMLVALERTDLAVNIEGEGERQDDGSVGASEVKVETDEDADHDDGDDDTGNEDEGPDQFEGTVALVSLEGEAPTRTARVELSHTGGTVLVDILEGSTAFDEDGDVLTFEGMLVALERTDLAVKIEGEGERQDDGSLTATNLRVETDDGS